MAHITPSGGGGAPVETLIASQVLGSAAATIDFSSIPATYNHLRLVVIGASSAAAGNDNLLARFNNDSGANYDTQTVQANGASPTSSATVAGTSGFLGNLPGTTSSAHAAGTSEIDIPLYAGTVFDKLAVGESTFVISAGSVFIYAFGIQWRSQAAINRITLLLASAANFVVGSAAYLYGVN